MRENIRTVALLIGSIAILIGAISLAWFGPAKIAADGGVESAIRELTQEIKKFK